MKFFNSIFLVALVCLVTNPAVVVGQPQDEAVVEGQPEGDATGVAPGGDELPEANDDATPAEGGVEGVLEDAIGDETDAPTADNTDGAAPATTADGGADLPANLGNTNEEDAENEEYYGLDEEDTGGDEGEPGANGSSPSKAGTAASTRIAGIAAAVAAFVMMK